MILVVVAVWTGLAVAALLVLAIASRPPGCIDCAGSGAIHDSTTPRGRTCERCMGSGLR